MECADIRRNFVAGDVPTGPEVDVHFKTCPHCRELFGNGAELGRRLAQAVTPEVNPGDLFAQVERDMLGEVGTRARLRALSTRVRVGALIGGAAALFVGQLLLRPRPDFEQYSTGVFWDCVVLLGAAGVPGTGALMRGASAPPTSHSRERWVALTLLALPAFMALLVPLGSPSAATAATWGSPVACFSYGAALVAPLLLLYWLLERRDEVPLMVLLSAGGLAGIAANLLLHARCPSVHLGHLLLGHASIGVMWALALGLLSKRRHRAR